MKALEILNQQLRDETLWLDNHEEAIKELEELIKLKTCAGCKQSWMPNNQTFHKFFCEYLRIPVHGNFCCNRYEQKV